MYPAKLYPPKLKQHLINTIQYELSAEGANWGIENTPNCPRLTVSLHHNPARPCRSKGSIGLVMMMTRRIMVMMVMIMLIIMMMMTTYVPPTLEESKHECRQSRPAQISLLWWCFLCYDDVDYVDIMLWYFLLYNDIFFGGQLWGWLISTSLILLLNLFCQIGLKNTTLVMIKLYLAMIDGLWLMTIVE